MSITGKKRQPLTREIILEKITSYDVFFKYMPWKFILNRACKSPFTDDRHPSMIIGNKFGEVTFKCFNSENRGSCFDFVMQLYNISYIEALHKIAQDFGVLDGSVIKPSDVINYKQPQSLIEPVFLQASAKPFTEEDKAYLASYHLTPADLKFCRDTKVYSTLEWAVNRKKQVLNDGEVCFYYHLKNERGEWIKVYRPNAPKDKKWRSSIPFTEMHGVGNIAPGCKVGIISKSLKDGAFISKYILPCIEIVQAEDYAAITPENKRRLMESCETLYISFDNDPKGVESSIRLVKELGCKYINPPKKLYERGITDWTDWAKADGKEIIIEYFKSKKLII